MVLVVAAVLVHDGVLLARLDVAALLGVGQHQHQDVVHGTILDDGDQHLTNLGVRRRGGKHIILLEEGKEEIWQLHQHVLDEGCQLVVVCRSLAVVVQQHVQSAQNRIAPRVRQQRLETESGIWRRQ